MKKLFKKLFHFLYEKEKTILEKSKEYNKNILGFSDKEILNDLTEQRKDKSKSNGSNGEMNKESDIFLEINDRLQDVINIVTILQHEIKYNLTEEQKEKIKHQTNLNRMKKLIEYKLGN